MFSPPSMLIPNVFTRASRRKFTDSFTSENVDNEIENVVFLHCLYDSPNHNFDQERIFYDYIDWITKTLEVISRDDRPWIVRTHPHSALLGEDTYNVLCRYPKVRKLFKSSNIFLQFGHAAKLPPLSAFLKIVTYCGTVAEEAVSYHRRPITIAHTFVSQLFPDLCFKPTSFSDYEKLLLSKHDKIFSLPPDSVSSFDCYQKRIADIIPSALRFSVSTGYVEYRGALMPSEIDDYLALMLSLKSD